MLLLRIHAHLVNKGETASIIHHIFWRCASVETFWQNRQQANHECDAEAGIHFHSGALNESVVLFGHDEHFQSDATFDLILLLGKLFIYKLM